MVLVMTLVDNLPVSSVVDLINEYSNVTQAVADESDMPYPPLEDLDTFGAAPSELVALANDLHQVFAEPDQAAELLNRLADQHRLSHRLASDGRLIWMRHPTSSRTATAATAALIDFIDRNNSDRLGTCNAHACVDVYIDASQAQTRSYCSDQCHSRTRVARWRARQQQATPTTPHKENPRT